MPSSEPTSDPQVMTVSSPETGDARPGRTGIAASVVILLAGALIMIAVSRGAPGGGDLPLLPPLGGDSRVGVETLTIAATPPPSSLGPGVSTPADRAPAYRIAEGSAADVVTTLATALGFTAAPESRSDSRGFLIVDAGSDRLLRVENAPGYPWSVQRGDPDCIDQPDSSVSSDGTISCPSSDGSTGPGAVQGSEPSPGSEEPGSEEQVRCPPVECPEGQACAQVCPEPELMVPQPEPFAQLPNPQETEQLARRIIQSLGVEVARSTLSVAPDGRSWQVLAELAVGGIPAVGMDTLLSISGEAEVVAGRGMIPTVDLLGEYPVITADEALIRLREVHSPNDQPRFDGREPAGRPEPAIDDDLLLPPTEETFVTAMRLVLLLQTTPGGGVFLVPAFQIDGSDGGTFTVPAARDEHLTPT